MSKTLLWAYAGLTPNGKKEAGANLTTDEIAKITSRNWLVLDVKPYTKKIVVKAGKTKTRKSK